MRDLRPATLAVLFCTIIVAGAVAAVDGWQTAHALSAVSPNQWLTFGLFVPLATAAFMYPIHLSDGANYNVAMAFAFAAALRLPPSLLFIMCAIMVIPGTIKERRGAKWVRAAFNAANWMLAALAASGIVSITGSADMDEPLAMVWVLVAIAVYVLIVTVMVDVAISLNTGVPVHKVEGWEPRLLALDGLIALMGALVALLSAIHPWALALAVIPLALPYWLFKGIHLVRLADTEPKTGLYNHRYFQKALRAEAARGRERARPLSILFADLDYLREINNAHGHLAGDAVIVQLAALLSEYTRQGDIASRWGGEEFALILPGTDLELAAQIAERLCRAVREHDFDIGLAEPVHCTISIGVAAAPRHTWDPDQLVHHADVAVYDAKARGRDRVCLAGSRTEQRQLSDDPYIAEPVA